MIVSTRHTILIQHIQNIPAHTIILPDPYPTAPQRFALTGIGQALFFDVHGIDPQYAAVLDQTLAQENLRKKPTRTPRSEVGTAREQKTKKPARTAEQELEEQGLIKMTSAMQLLGNVNETLPTGEHGLGLGGMGNMEGTHYRGMTSERLTELIDEVFDMLDYTNDGILVLTEVLTALGQHAGGDAEAAKDEFDMIEMVRSPLLLLLLQCGLMGRAAHLDAHLVEASAALLSATVVVLYRMLLLGTSVSSCSLNPERLF